MAGMPSYELLYPEAPPQVRRANCRRTDHALRTNPFTVRAGWRSSPHCFARGHGYPPPPAAGPFFARRESTPARPDLQGLLSAGAAEPGKGWSGSQPRPRGATWPNGRWRVNGAPQSPPSCHLKMPLFGGLGAARSPERGGPSGRHKRRLGPWPLGDGLPVGRHRVRLLRYDGVYLAAFGSQRVQGPRRLEISGPCATRQSGALSTPRGGRAGGSSGDLFRGRVIHS